MADIVEAVDVPAPALNGPQCRMRDCRARAVDRFGFCGEHHRLLADNARFCPCVIRPIGDEGVTGMYCALCDGQVWPLHRLDDVQQGYWGIDAVPSIDGRCWIIDGGFRVITSDRQRDALLSDGVLLYRTHPSICPRRPLQQIATDAEREREHEAMTEVESEEESDG